jgi:hypothetical protein
MFVSPDSQEERQFGWLQADNSPLFTFTTGARFLKAMKETPMLRGSRKGRMPWSSEEYSCLKLERSEIKVSTRSQVILRLSDFVQYLPTRADTLPQLDYDRFFPRPPQFIIQ